MSLNHFEYSIVEKSKRIFIQKKNKLLVFTVNKRLASVVCSIRGKLSIRAI
jgi:hypothetical protein